MIARIRISFLITVCFMIAACSSPVEPTLDDLQRTALIGNWNKFENADAFTPQGFRFQMGFGSDGKYQFVTFDLVEITGTWKYGGENAIVISDTICASAGNFEYSVDEGVLILTNLDIADDGCGREIRLGGEWLRSGTIDR